MFRDQRDHPALKLTTDLYSVPELRREAEQLPEVDLVGAERLHDCPSVVPDGRVARLVQLYSSGDAAREEEGEVVRGDGAVPLQL